MPRKRALGGAFGEQRPQRAGAAQLHAQPAVELGVAGEQRRRGAGLAEAVGDRGAGRARAPGSPARFRPGAPARRARRSARAGTGTGVSESVIGHRRRLGLERRPAMLRSIPERTNMVSPHAVTQGLPLRCACLALLPPAAPRAGDFDDMVAAERAFAADASARSMRDAFLAAWPTTASLSRPARATASASGRRGRPNKNRLEWAPEAGRDRRQRRPGLHQRPVALHRRRATTSLSAFGHFFSIWRKQADGKWKVLVDHGIGHAERRFPDKVQRRGGIGAGAPPTWPVGMRRTAQRRPGARRASSTPRMVSADFLRLREGSRPTGGRRRGAAVARRCASTPGR